MRCFVAMSKPSHWYCSVLELYTSSVARSNCVKIISLFSGGMGCVNFHCSRGRSHTWSTGRIL